MILRRACAGLCLLLLAAPLTRAQGLERVLAAIEGDPSFKVRMQAIRVLAKQLRARGEPPSAAALAALGRAAENDEEYLVRGLACWAMGELKDPRARAHLQRAQGDKEAFVRAQAEQALVALAPAVAPGPGTPRTLVVGADLAPLRQAMLEAYRAQAGARFSVAEADPGGSGLRMSGSVAEKSLSPEPGGQRITVVVRITIATLPENHLRHVVSARASLVAKGAGASGAEEKVIRAAADRAVQESLTLLGDQ